MSALNIFVLSALIAGVVAMIAGLMHNKSSSFDDGSFIIQMLMIVGGGFLIVAALVAKFIASLFG